MSFLHPTLFLYLLPLVAIPIALHLLTLQRIRTVELSTYRFLFESYMHERRRMRFMEAILAALRTLFVLLLLAMIARPVLQHWNSLFGGGGGRDVVLLVDTSASMNAQTGGVTSLDRAKDVALAVVKQLSPDDRVTLYEVSSRPEEVFRSFRADTESIPDAIRNLKSSGARGNVFAAVREVARTNEQRVKPAVYLFTDCQKSNWSELQEQGLDVPFGSDSECIVVDVGSKEKKGNVAVVGNAPQYKRAVLGLPLVFQPVVANHGGEDVEETPISVVVNEKEVARTSVSIASGETASRELIYVPTEPGELQGRFEIPQDRFPDDNSFLFTLSIAPRLKIVLINGRPDNDPLKDAGLYIRTALTQTAEENDDKTLAELSVKREYLQTLVVDEIRDHELRDSHLQDASTVIMANCGHLGKDKYELLRDFVWRGGGLLIFPGDRTHRDQMEREFFSGRTSSDPRLTGATLNEDLGDPDDAGTFEHLAAVNYAHPVFSVFDVPNQRYFESVRFYRRFRLELSSGAVNSWPLAHLSDGRPALVESVYGQGRVMLAAFPLQASWTNLPLKPEFVPMLVRMVAYVEHQPDVAAPSLVGAGLPAEISVSDEWAPVNAKVRDLLGRATDVNFERSERRLVGAFERTDNKGYYSVDVHGGQVEQPKDATVSFAVNLDEQESDFSSADESQMRGWLGVGDFTYIDASAQAQQLYGAVTDRREIWRPLILFMFLVIGCEFMLATMGGPASDDDQRTVSQKLRDLYAKTFGREEDDF